MNKHATALASLLLLAVLPGCGPSHWQTSELASVSGKRASHLRPISYQQLCPVFDGIADRLYAAGFGLETNAPPYQPARFFSHLVARGESLSGSQTNFSLGRNTDNVECSVQIGPNEVWVVFYGAAITPDAAKTPRISEAQRQKAQASVEQISAYLHASLPASYRITVVTDHPAA